MNDFDMPPSGSIKKIFSTATMSDAVYCDFVKPLTRGREGHYVVRIATSRSTTIEELVLVPNMHGMGTGTSTSTSTGTGVGAGAGSALQSPPTFGIDGFTTAPYRFLTGRLPGHAVPSREPAAVKLQVAGETKYRVLLGLLLAHSHVAGAESDTSSSSPSNITTPPPIPASAKVLVFCATVSACDAQREA